MANTRWAVLLVAGLTGCAGPQTAAKTDAPKEEAAATGAEVKSGGTETTPAAKPAEATPEVKPAETTPAAKPAETAAAKPAETTPAAKSAETVAAKPADAGTAAKPTAKPAETAATKPADAGTAAKSTTGTTTRPVEPAAKPTETAAAKPSAGKYTLVKVPEPDKKVERLWKSKCSACHGLDGKAATEKGKKMAVDDMTTAAWQTSQTNAALKKGISDGTKSEKNGVKQEMDPFKEELSSEQIDGLVQFVRWLGAPK